MLKEAALWVEEKKRGGLVSEGQCSKGVRDGMGGRWTSSVRMNESPGHSRAWVIMQVYGDPPNPPWGREI